jgi:hypothetical protein
VKKAVKRRTATNWNAASYARGAFSSAAPGGQPARRVLMQAVRDRIWFAGEAAHETLWGTVVGAWESGERAAAAVIAHLGSASGSSRPARQDRQRPARAPRAPRAERRSPRRARPIEPLPGATLGPDDAVYPFRD